MHQVQGVQVGSGKVWGGQVKVEGEGWELEVGDCGHLKEMRFYAGGDSNGGVANG